jgi:hypothetical protein
MLMFFSLEKAVGSDLNNAEKMGAQFSILRWDFLTPHSIAAWHTEEKARAYGCGWYAEYLPADSDSTLPVAGPPLGVDYGDNLNLAREFAENYEELVPVEHDPACS